MITRVSGTRDVLPDEAEQWQFLEGAARRVFARYNFREIRPPLIEDAALFNRSLGESAEIVRKQMFLIRSGDDTYVLRPEGTASIVRAYIGHNIDKSRRCAKFYYMGPMFRRERPQKGRLRQFHHIGCEVIGSVQPQLDAEVIACADSLLKAWSLNGYTIHLNSLGCPDDKAKFADSLRLCLKDRIAELCGECRERYEYNVLRVLDCKIERCRQIVRDLNIHGEHLCGDCRLHFSAVREGLDALGIAYAVSPHLVRGLDYYTRTVFEITHGSLGAQDAVGAGGRYDNLVAGLGGPDAGAIGFAFGVERILLAKEREPAGKIQRLIYVIALGEPAKKHSVVLLNELRNAGIAADTDYEGKSLKGAMRTASDLGARHVIIIGDNELQKQTVTLKNMETGEQIGIQRNALIEHLSKSEDTRD